MKLKSTLTAATLMIFVASTATSFAAEEQPANGNTVTTKAENVVTKSKRSINRNLSSEA